MITLNLTPEQDLAVWNALKDRVEKISEELTNGIIKSNRRLWYGEADVDEIKEELINGIIKSNRSEAEGYPIVSTSPENLPEGPVKVSAKQAKELKAALEVLEIFETM